MAKHLLPGYIDESGRRVARPVIMETAPDGTVISHSLLQGHEPAFTTVLPKLLRLPDLALVDI